MVNEFEFIDHQRSRFSLGKVGDDCAVLPKDEISDQLLTADMLVEDVDFRLEWTKPEFLGRKAIAVSLSDIGAMGGYPQWAMLSIAVPGHLWRSKFLDRFYDGWMALALEFTVELVGGDISRSPDTLVIDSMVGGIVPKGKAILRSGANPGDGIYVTGTLGGASGGLKLLEQGIRSSATLDNNTNNLLLKQLNPYPQLRISKLLTSLNIISAMVDISDGLSSDLEHICRMSGVGAEIDEQKVPINPLLFNHFSKEECLELALNGGEDFELLFTANEKKFSEAKVSGITQIGSVTQTIGNIELKGTGYPRNLVPAGYRHF